jgi:hypothetical protein
VFGSILRRRGERKGANFLEDALFDSPNWGDLEGRGAKLVSTYMV